MQARCRFDSFSGSVMQLHTSLEDYYLESGSICLVCEIRNSRENGLGVVEFDLSSIIDYLIRIVIELLLLRHKD